MIFISSLRILCMLEFELRFRLEGDIAARLQELGFSKQCCFSMADIIFEPKDWIPGKGLCPGYQVVRIRLTSNSRPRLELKEYVNHTTWKEHGMEIDDPARFSELFSAIMVPRRVISKHREAWACGSVEIVLDNVKHLGKFIEIEGPQDEVRSVAEKLGFDPGKSELAYGTQLFYLEQDGKISFNLKEISEALEKYSSHI